MGSLGGAMSVHGPTAVVRGTAAVRPLSGENPTFGRRSQGCRWEPRSLDWTREVDVFLASGSTGRVSRVSVAMLAKVTSFDLGRMFNSIIRRQS
jgi:hypothetical protein